MSDLVKVYFVVSLRNHRTGHISYQLGSNMDEIPRGGRPVFGTGHTNRDVVMSRKKKCEAGVWFKEQHKARSARQREDDQVRQQLHERYLSRLGRGKKKRSRHKKVTN